MEGTKTIIRSVVQSPTQRGYGRAKEKGEIRGKGGGGGYNEKGVT